MLGTMVMDKTYTFVGPSAKDPFARSAWTPRSPSSRPPTATSRSRSLPRKARGVLFDPAAGRVVSSHVNDKLEMSLSVMGQTLEQTTDTVTSMTLAGWAVEAE